MTARNVLSILLACVLVLAVTVAPAAAEPVERPFRAVFSGDVVFTPGAEFGLPPNPAPPFIYTVSLASGTSRHLGLTTMFSYHPTPTGETISGGHMTLTAANGDEVYFEYSGSAPLPVIGVPSTVHVVCTYTITGGTGRFDGATGSGTGDAYVEFPGELLPLWTGTWEWVGTIAY